MKNTILAMVALLAFAVHAQETPPPLVSADPVRVPRAPKADSNRTPRTISAADRTHAERFKFGGDAVPRGFHLVEEPLWGLFAGGISAFLVGYAPVAVIGTSAGAPILAVPIFGPIMAFRPASGWFAELANGLIIVGIATDVAVQVAGVAMMIGGLAAKRRWLEHDESAFSLSFVPSAPGAPLGATLVGRF